MNTKQIRFPQPYAIMKRLQSEKQLTLARLCPELEGMRIVWAIRLLLLASSLLCARAESGKIIKVLPELLDRKGRESLSPSLYERDAYQARLRKTPAEIGGMRFAVQWKSQSPASSLKLRMELRGSKGALAKPVIIEQVVNSKRWLSTWSYVKLDAKSLAEAGEILSWRATLWRDDTLLAEQKSFLWAKPSG